MKQVAQYGLLLTVALGLVCSQLLMKQGVGNRGLKLASFSDFVFLIQTILTTPKLLAGYALSIVIGLLWLVALSRMDLSYATPVMNGMFYVLLLAASATFLREPVDGWRLSGIALIVAGISLVSRSAV